MITSNAAIGNTINKAISGGLSGGLGAAINSGDAGGGALRGFTQGAVSGLAGQYVGNQAAGVIGSTISKALVPVGGAVSTPAASQQAPSTGATASSGFGTGASLLSTTADTLGYGTPSQLRAQRGITRRAA
jgi:hypothetical protein